MKIFLILLIAVIVASCHCEHHVKPTCGTNATVVDLASNGCAGLGFKLADGTLLAPLYSFCGTGHGAGHDPLSNFELIAGQEVVVGYEKEASSPCASISGARITCITLVEPDEK